MARSTFGIGSLNAAQPGLSKLAAALVGGQDAYQAGFDGTVNAQSKIAQTLAEIRAQNASAGAHDAQAAETRAKTGVLSGRPDLFNVQVANAAGTDVPTLNGYMSQLKTGVAPQVPMGPPTEDGAMGVGSLVIPDDKRSKIASAIQQFLPLLADSGDLKPDDLAKAATEFGQQGRLQGILSGALDRNRVAGAEAAIAAKPLFHSGEDGAVLDQYGGQLATDNPMARATIAQRNAQAMHARASAAAAAQGMKGVIQQTDDGFVVIDPRTKTATPVLGPDGQQIAGKSKPLKDIPPQANQKIIDGQQGITNIDDAIASLEKNPGAGGWSNSLPFSQTVKQYTSTPGEIETRGKVANIGSLVLHDRSGAAVSASEFPRLAPFIPSPSDSNPVAATKLRNMKRIAEEELGLYASTYGPDNGYRASPVLKDHSTPEPPPAPGAQVGWKYLGKE